MNCGSWKLLIAFLILCLGERSHATTIVGLLDENCVVLAADGETTIEETSGREHSEFGNKICEVHGIYFALCGLVRACNGYDAYAVVRGDLESGEEFRVSLDQIKNDLAKKFLIIYRDKLGSRITISDNELRKTRIQVVLSHWGKGSPELGIVRDEIVRDGEDGTKLETKSEVVLPLRKGLRMRVFGQIKEAEQEYEEWVNAPNDKRDGVQLARDMITREIQAGNAGVGYPVTVWIKTGTGDHFKEFHGLSP